MDEEIVIDRGNTSVMKLDADEQAIMDEIEISAPALSVYLDQLDPLIIHPHGTPTGKYGCLCEPQQTD